MPQPITTIIDYVTFCTKPGQVCANMKDLLFDRDQKNSVFGEISRSANSSASAQKHAQNEINTLNNKKHQNCSTDAILVFIFVLT